MRLFPWTLLLALGLFAGLAIPLIAQLQGTSGAFDMGSDTSSHGSSNSTAAAVTRTSASELVATDPSHLLQPQDTLRVQVFGEPDINKQCETVIVSQELTLTLPLLNVFSVKNMTIGAAQELIRKLYDKDFLVNPQVNVMVLKYADRSVNVVGSVTNQGRKEFPSQNDLSIVDAIALAGGQTRLADLKHVKLTRMNADGASEVRVLDVDGMMKSNGAERVLLKPGDTIFVPERTL